MLEISIGVGAFVQYIDRTTLDEGARERDYR